MPINATEMEKMREIMSLLKQFNGFQYFDDLGATIAKLENSIYTKQKKSISYIQIENNHQLKGIEYIEPLFQATRQKKVMRIAYQSFKSPEPKQRIYYPYLLKEYRNRWFLIAKTSKIEVLQTLALDRIVSLEEVTDGIFLECNIDFEAYYNNTLGVTRSEKDEPKRVILRFNAVTAPYILTKPFHSSQEVLKNDPTEGVIISVNLILNFELEREILGFGEHVEVLSPRFLSNKIRRRIELAISQYKK